MDYSSTFCVDINIEYAKAKAKAIATAPILSSGKATVRTMSSSPSLTSSVQPKRMPGGRDGNNNNNKQPAAPLPFDYSK
ncbi:MAG: hypothetical protein ACI8RD_003908 [Bacillariaceae sp.]|jgi:hypothetical protein